MYLEPIFSSDEMKTEMPQEREYFVTVDDGWRRIMSFINESPLIYNHSELDVISKQLILNNDLLEKINKELNTYLEKKRHLFPRFYFLSDEELLVILSKAKDPTLVKRYINKCFDSIDTIEFNQKLEVLCMVSAEKEVIPFLKPVVTNEAEKRGKVEIWLRDLEQMMRDTLIQRSVEAAADDKTERTKWILKWPAQIVIAVNNVRWTSGVESAIKSDTLQKYYKTLLEERDEVVDMVKGELTMLERLSLGALIVIDQHAIYVVEMLLRERIQTDQDFDWISQLRYYFRGKKKNMLETNMITATLPYQYEYLGNSDRLVITPLTDRCYRTLMGAFESFYGGAPEGPAGTGKTETVKDLAKAVAVQCVVFNCSDQMNYVAMSKFFKGLSQSGAWCCFDEFNRIIPEVLSVISLQIRTIQTAVRKRENRFFFEGGWCNLNFSTFTCITMNPGYAGRSELPDNLKALFRPCAMMVPDYSLIAEIVLFSSGFREAQPMSKKLVASLRLSSEQLSSQKHYDFGMRALKSILVAAGNLKKQWPKENETKLCIRSLFDVNLPKFTQNDIPLFLSIVNDLFGETEKLETDYTLLVEMITKVSEDLKILPSPIFLSKCQQLYETLLVRHGLMLVGQTISGKSQVIQALRNALTNLDGQLKFVKTQTFYLNPKAIDSFQLYGKLDADTKLWTDGVLPQIMRYCEDRADEQERKWVVFDGPVDAVWIENMNTVLDDNKILCLTNGQKIKVTNWMNLMFEVEDLINASPATVSRCGMVYLEPEQLGWEPLMRAYLKYKLVECLKELRKNIWKRMDYYLTPSLVFVQKQCKLPFKVDEMQMTSAVIKIFDSLCQSLVSREIPVSGKEGEALINNYSLFSIFWGIGGVLEEGSRKDFHAFIMKMIYFEDVVEIYKLDLGDRKWTPNGIAYDFGAKIESLYDLVFDISSDEWLPWVKTIPRWQPPKDDKVRYSEIIVPTSDTIRSEFFVKLMIENSNHVLLTGPTGTAKTIGGLTLLNREYNNAQVGNLQTVFSGQTQANQVQRMIESKMTSRRGGKGHWGPEDNKNKLVVFIDDVNMPQKEEYGAQPPIELLRMWCDYGYWYDLEEREKKFLHDMILVATMGPPSGGRNSVTRRFLRHFFILYTESFSKESLELIFSSILDWYFLNIRGQLPNPIIAMKEQIVRATIRIYKEVTQSLLPTPSKSHYLYNLRDISRVFQGITKAGIKTFGEPNDFVKLWAHECTRVFMDRMTNKEDIDLFQNNILKTVMKEDLKR